MKQSKTSHDLARAMQRQAEFLLSRPAFELEATLDDKQWVFCHFYTKEPFLAAAKALGSGRKEFTETEVKFVVERPDGQITLDAPRNTVCRLVRPAEYDCDPFLSPDEEKQLGGAA